MSNSFSDYLVESCSVLENTARVIPQQKIDRATKAIVASLRDGKALLVCGNGGSASDAEHITGELVGRFLHERRALKVLCLSSQTSVLTAWSNDYRFEDVFARQVEAYGETGAALLGLSTSGASQNVFAAFKKAKDLGMTTIALTGEDGGRLAMLADYLLAVPSRSTPLIQQSHLCIYHYLCRSIERAFLEADSGREAVRAGSISSQV